MSEFCKHKTHESQYCGSCVSDTLDAKDAIIAELQAACELHIGARSASAYVEAMEVTRAALKRARELYDK